MANEFKVRKSLVINGSGSVLLDVQGSQGQLFSITDSLSGSLFAVKDISGIPVMEAFSDNTVRMGQFGQRVLFISQSRIGIGKETPLNGILDISGSATVTGSLNVSGNLTSTGTIIAQTLLVQTVTSSIEFNTGSTRNGSLLTDTHQFTGSVLMTGSLTVAGNILSSADNVYTLGAASTRFTNIYSANGVISTLFNAIIRASSNSILFGSNQTNYWGGFIGNSSTSPGNLILTYTSSAGLGGDNGYKLQIYSTGSASGSLFVNGTSSFTGSVNITGSLSMSPSSSFVLPLTASASPTIGSAYWSGSLLFVYNGTRYMSSSFA